MPGESFIRVTEQVVEHLRTGMLTGRWKGTLPGRDRLAAELGVSHTTVEAAMRRLAKEGLLASAGAGRRRRIVLAAKTAVPKDFRIRILLYETGDQQVPYVVDLLERLKKAGFSADTTRKTLLDLGMNVQRVARFVEQNPADAWVIAAGSREILGWFCEQPTPAYAFFGNKSALPIAGCGVRYDIRPIIQRLTGLGHRRIVLLIREEHVSPTPGFFARNFLAALESEGITASSYNLPAWGNRPEGLHRCLDSLFQVSPPTAIIAAEPPILLATRDHLSQRGIIAPRDVSLIVTDQDPSFSWLDPLVTHFTWDHTTLTRRIVAWARNVARGKDDKAQTVAMARMVEGGTMGPAPGFKGQP